MNEQRVIRKAVSDLSCKFDRYKLTNDLETINTSGTIDEEVRQVECNCCGLKEECTTPYILEIERSFSGKWVCGLCSEAVKERMLKFPNATIHEAVKAHRDFCDTFNSTTRLNPKLSLTSAMREIARKSCEKRNSNKLASSKLARSISCDPRIDLKN